MRKLFYHFIFVWIIVFLISFFTAMDSITLSQRLGYTAILSAIPALCLSSNKKSAPPQKAPAEPYYTIHRPSDPKVLYRVEGGKVYRGLDVAPIYTVKGNKVYPNLDSKPAYRIEDGKIYRKMEAAPILEIKGRKVYRALSSKVIYEIKTGRKNQ